jgi:hypothetical protein
VRPWLVVIGVVFLTLSAGTIAILYFGGDGNPTTVVTPYQPLALAANETEPLTLYGSNGSSEQFSLNWHATAPLAVTLIESNCTATCSATHVLVNWSSSLSGAWTGSGPFVYPLRCTVHNLQSEPVTLSLTGRAVASSTAHFSLGFEVVLGAGAAGLLVVAGLAIFLGIFLRADPYGPEPDLVSRSAEDVEEIAGPPPPDH